MNVFFVNVKFILKAYDSCCLLKAYNGPACSILVDQGNDDQFLKVNQLLPEKLVEAGKENSLVDVKVRYHEVKISYLFCFYIICVGDIFFIFEFYFERDMITRTTSLLRLSKTIWIFMLRT